jgi:hypothetical protein
MFQAPTKTFKNGAPVPKIYGALGYGIFDIGGGGGNGRSAL